MHRFLFWKGSLRTAKTVADVRRIMDDYLRTLCSEDIEELPPGCWDSLTLEDIAGSALLLTREGLKSSANGVLHEIAQTYVAAADRIVAIEAQGEPTGAREMQTAPRTGPFFAGKESF